MSNHALDQSTLDIDDLRQAIQDEYAAVALDPGRVDLCSRRAHDGC